MAGLKRGVLAGPEDLRLASQPRKLFNSKGENGRVVIIGGSSDFHGAPVLASSAAFNTLAALRMGTGYALLYVPKSILTPVRKLSPNLIVRAFGRRSIGEGSFASIREAVRKADSVVIGMGIGREKKTLRMAARIIRYAISLKKGTVIDADAIYSVRLLKKLDGNVIVTPQDREFMELSGKMPVRSSLPSRINAAKALARRLNSCVLLKGHKTVITDGKEVRVVSSRSSALATMGTGDVLSGIIGGYAATGADVFRSGVAGAYLHARLGDLLHKEKGNHIISSDLVEKIPFLLRRFDRNEGG